MENVKEILGFYKEFRFLDNFFEREFTYNGAVYPTAEHAFQATKTFNPTMAEEIRNAPTPAEAKHIGQLVKMRVDWEEVKRGVMEEIVRAKFNQHPDLMEKLVATGSAYLGETNRHHDNTYGNCICGTCLERHGRNWLGKILMKIRNDQFFK